MMSKQSSEQKLTELMGTLIFSMTCKLLHCHDGGDSI
jgi:hypothetical protein